MSFMAVLYAETNWLMESVALDVSGVTVTLTADEGDGETRFRVKPLMALVTMLEVLLMGMPSTASEALEPVTALVKLRPEVLPEDRKSTRLNSSHRTISYAVF